MPQSFSLLLCCLGWIVVASSTPQVFKFPDGSAFRGFTKDGKMSGQGMWRSANGDMYEGGFSRDAFEGKGRFTDAQTGNSYVGDFKEGQYDGVGTFYYGDGRAEVGTYQAGKDVSGGMRWSVDRTRAWRLLDGHVVGECSLAEAAAAAKVLGLDVPKSVFSLNDAGIERLKANLHRPNLKSTKINDATIDSSMKSNFGYDPAFEALLIDTHSRPDLKPSCDDRSSVESLVPKLPPRPLVVYSRQPVVRSEICDHIVRECEDRATRLGGWTTQRHENYPTTDVPLTKLPGALAWFTESLLPDIAFPFLAKAFKNSFYADVPFKSEEDGVSTVAAPSSGEQKLGLSLRIVDAFVVKYNASAGQRELLPHRDGSVFSFNIALNDDNEYKGGGTSFRQHVGADPKTAEGAVRSPKGHILAHASALMHGGHSISSGCRYILVAFVSVDTAHREAAIKFYEHVRDHDTETSSIVKDILLK